MHVFYTMPINVKDSPYRASGSGATDDTDAILNALDAAANSGGGAVFLPAGRYATSKPITWTAPDVWLEGDGGGTKIHTLPSFQGSAVIQIGQSSTIPSPTERAGLSRISVDISDCPMPNLIGVELAECWFAHVEALRIFSPNGLSVPRQTAFQMSGGTGKEWTPNNNIYNLQISGSFLYGIRHIACLGAMVNGTNYFGGFAYGNTANGHKDGTTGFRIDPGAGDTTRVYGMALEDFDIGVYVGSPNNGPMDFRIEDCATAYMTAPGITFSIPSIIQKP